MGQAVTVPDMTAPVPSLIHVLTPPQVAKFLGWSRRRTFRYLKQANNRMGGKLLHNTNEGGERPRWTVSVAALRLLAPQWFHDLERCQVEFEFMRDYAEHQAESVETLQSKIKTLEGQVRMLVDRVGEIAKVGK